MKKIILALLLILALVSTSEGQRNLRKIQRGNPTGSGDPLRSTAGGSPPAPAATNGEVGNKSGSLDDSVNPWSYPGNDEGIGACFEAGTSGTISYIHIYMNTSSGTTGQQYNAAIYDASGNLIRDGSLSDEPGTVPGRLSIALDSPTNVVAGTTYCLFFGSHNSPDGWSIGSTIIIGSNTLIDSDSFTVGATMPSTVSVVDVRTEHYVVRIWATNTSDGS